MTSVLKPDYCALFDGKTKEYILFAPEWTEECSLWMGKGVPMEEQ